MSVKNCFKNSSNKAIKSSFDKKVKAGIPEEEAALAVIKEYGADIQARLSKIKGVDVADIVLFDGVVKTETKKSMVTTQQQAVRIVSREKEIDPGIKGLRNRVIDLFTMALKDPKYFEETMTSIDNDTLKEGTLSMIDKIAPESMDLFDPVKAIDTRFSYRTGGSGVAVSANSSSDHVLTQGVNWNIEFDQGTWGNSTFDQKFSEELSNEDFNSLLEHINSYRIKSGKSLLSKDEGAEKFKKVKIASSLSELINAFVDIANEDAFVTRGNWGDISNGYGMMMIRAGIHPHKVSAMLRQPSFVQLMDTITNNEGIIENESSSDIEQRLLKEWRNNALEMGVNKELLKNSIGNATLDGLDFKSLLNSAVSQKTNTPQEALNQYILLRNYINAKDTIKRYNNAVTSTKNDANGAGNSIQNMFVTLNKLSDSYYGDMDQKEGIKYGIKNLKYKFFDKAGNTRLAYMMHNNTVGVMKNIIRDNPTMFDGVNEGVFEGLNRAASHNTRSIRLDSVNRAEYISEQFAAYQMSEFGPITKEDTKEEFDRFIQEVIELKRQRKYQLLNKMLIDFEDKSTPLKMQGVSQRSAEAKNTMTDSWRLIIRDNPALGDFLVRQAYRQSAFLPGPLQFHELIPFEWFLSKGYLGFITRENRPTVDENFLNQMVRKDDASEFFMTLRLESNGNHYIINLNQEKDLGMGKVNGPASPARAPMFALRQVGKVTKPVKLLGTVTKQKVDPQGKTTKITHAVYMELEKPDGYVQSYNSNHEEFMKEVDPLGVELQREKTWLEVPTRMQDRDPKAKVIANTLNHLRSNKGAVFFRDPGMIVDLAMERELTIGRTSDGVIPEQMCGA